MVGGHKRYESEDSLHDPNYPDPSPSTPYNNQNSRRRASSVKSNRSVKSNKSSRSLPLRRSIPDLNDQEAEQWNQAISSFNHSEQLDLDEDLSPKSAAAPSVRRDTIDLGQREYLASPTRSNNGFDFDNRRGTIQEYLEDEVSPTSTSNQVIPTIIYPDDHPPSPEYSFRVETTNMPRPLYPQGPSSLDSSPASETSETVRYPSIQVRRPTGPTDLRPRYSDDEDDDDDEEEEIINEEEDEDDEYMPSFTAPAPSIPPRPPINPLRASISIDNNRPERPTLRPSGSDMPLMHDVSGANSPSSAYGNPFFDSVSVGDGSSLDGSPQIAEARNGRIASASTYQPPNLNPNAVAGSSRTPFGDNQAVDMSRPYQRQIPIRRSSLAQSTEDLHLQQGNYMFSDMPISTTAPNPAMDSIENLDEVALDEVDGLSTGRSSALRSEGLKSMTSLKASKTSLAERRKERMAKVAAKRKKEGKPVLAQINRKAFQSTRLKEEIYKPWLEKKDPALRWARWITLLSIFLGFVVMGGLCYDGYASVPKIGKICPILSDDFSNGIDESIWTREVRTDGYGHGSFDWSTPSPNNSFVDSNTLYLVPTLTSDLIGESAISNGYTLNLTEQGICTSQNVSQCVAVSNSSQLTVINPVMSARLTTRQSVSMRYGRVEVVAKFPTGDWLWPSIVMLPVNNTYGPAPRSGEIDIMSGRGNNASYTARGVDYSQSALHWGPTSDLDRLYLTWGYREQRRTYYNQEFHTFGMEWNDQFLWTYIDSRVDQVISLRFNKQSFWQRGNFPSTITNGTNGDIIRLTNPWVSAENNVAPFDQPFYLAISLNVGAMDGWFPDGEGGKPWLDNSPAAMSDFWNAKSRWWSNWPSDPKQRGFAIKSVKMWKTC